MECPLGTDLRSSPTRPGPKPRFPAGASPFVEAGGDGPARARRVGGAPRLRPSLASPPVQTLRRTPLYDHHVAAGARMVPFAGWEMPVQYASVIAEHRAVRTERCLFDLSHMGEIEVEGLPGQAFLQH